jgi:hypothetical protein
VTTDADFSLLLLLRFANYVLVMQEHMKGPEARARELEELTQIYVARGLSYSLAKQVQQIDHSLEHGLLCTPISCHISINKLFPFLR